MLVLVESGVEIVGNDEQMEVAYGETFVDVGKLTQKDFILRKALGTMDANKQDCL